MVHHVTKIEEVTFMVHEIAILKHPKTLMTKEDWEKYRKLASSYVHHRDKVFLVVRRFDEWRNHSYTRDYESERTLYNPSAGSERYKEGDFIVHEEIEPAMGEDEEEDYGELNVHERETIELEKEVANLEHPSARIELQLVWGPSIRESQDQECTETQITSPYVLKLNDFIQRNITCMTAGEVAFEIEHTDREVELSFRNPLRGPEYNFRKIRIFFHENEELQDFLSRIDVLIGVRRSKVGLRMLRNQTQEQTQPQNLIKTEVRNERRQHVYKTPEKRMQLRLRTARLRHAVPSCRPSNAR